MKNYYLKVISAFNIPNLEIILGFRRDYSGIRNTVYNKMKNLERGPALRQYIKSENYVL